MALKHDGNGMISLIDAMAFVALISLVSLSLFTFYSADADDEPMAKDLCEKFVSIELKASDVFDTEDSEVYGISVLIDSHMATDENDSVESYVRSVIENLVPKPYGYVFEITTVDGTIHFEREGKTGSESDYSVSVGTYGDRTVDYCLKIK